MAMAELLCQSIPFHSGIVALHNGVSIRHRKHEGCKHVYVAPFPPRRFNVFSRMDFVFFRPPGADAETFHPNPSNTEIHSPSKEQCVEGIASASVSGMYHRCEKLDTTMYFLCTANVSGMYHGYVMMVITMYFSYIMDVLERVSYRAYTSVSLQILPITFWGPVYQELNPGRPSQSNWAAFTLANNAMLYMLCVVTVVH